MRTSKKVVLAAISAIILFWVMETVLLFVTGAGYPDAFVAAWFTFWSVELAALAGIKITEARVSPYKGDGGEDEVG